MKVPYKLREGFNRAMYAINQEMVLFALAVSIVIASSISTTEISNKIKTIIDQKIENKFPPIKNKEVVPYPADDSIPDQKETE